MATTAARMVAEARSRIRNLSPAELADDLACRDPLLVDLREPAEVEGHGTIGGAVHAPRGMLEFWADPQSPVHRRGFDPVRPTVLYCSSGGRSALAVETLRALGYRDVAHLDGGFDAWREQGFAVLPATNTTR